MNNYFNNLKWSKIKSFKEYQKEVFEKSKKDHPIISLINFEEIQIKNESNLLKNIPFSFKDNFSTKLQRTTAGTFILDNYHPNFNSTIFVKLIKARAIPLFSSNLDELAMGGSGLSSHFDIVVNPFDDKRIVGGSSSGSAYQMGAEDVGFAIGSDTGDSVRKPAGYVGVVGFKPTWGLVSRYGLFDFAPSWDTVSWFTKKVSESAILLDILQGKDDKDMSSIEPKENEFLKNLETNKKFKIGIFRNLISGLDQTVSKNWNKTLESIRKQGHNIIEIDVDLDLFNAILPMYRTISSLEAFSCNSNLTGFLFGEKGDGDSFEQQIIDARTKGFAYEVKKRFLWGNYVLLETDSYRKALKVRTLIIRFLEKCFLNVDAIVMPTSPTIAPKIEEYKHQTSTNILEDFLAIYNANGSPSISIPNYELEKELPTSINISTAPFEDLKCLQIANMLESKN